MTGWARGREEIAGMLERGELSQITANAELAWLAGAPGSGAPGSGAPGSGQVLTFGGDLRERVLSPGLTTG